jgi:hypothetical protein
MSTAATKLEQVVSKIETHLEFWKQFQLFIAQARAKKFTSEEELQFLEIKTAIVQESEILFASVECPSPTREEVLGLISSAPSLHFLSVSNAGTLLNLENQWHKIFIAWQSLLGQLKARQQRSDSRSFLSGLFSRNHHA